MSNYSVTLLPAQKAFLEMPDNEYDLDIALYQGGFGS